jgi:putative DNA methylase
MSEGTSPTRRLIEEAFPLKKVSEDSKHEKNVRHGHISTLHIWPARRPLAAARAAAIAALLPDPGDERRREDLCKRIESITRWGTENGTELKKFREEIRGAYGGRAPRVLDMFAGGGAIPFEAMRLGCDVTAIDYNPVAWLLLRCTLEYPQRFAGQTWPIPPELEKYLEPAESNRKAADKRRQAANNGENIQPTLMQQERRGSLADHVRAWGGWVLDHARQELEQFYPAVDGKTPLTYLWARTAPCPDPNCGTAVPLLKTLWLNKGRVALRIATEGKSGPVHFEIWKPGKDEEADKPIMAAAKATCPRCGTQLPTEYLREQGQQGHMGTQMTTVVVEGEDGKEYRLPTTEDIAAVQAAVTLLPTIEQRVPLGRPSEPISPAYLSSRHQAAIIVGYGLNHFDQIFTDRMLLAMLTLIYWTYQASAAMKAAGYDSISINAISAYLALVIDRIADRGSTLAHWEVTRETIANTFSGPRLDMTWDFTEANPTVKTSGGYPGQIEWVTKVIEHALQAADDQTPKVRQGSAADLADHNFYDAIITDPPYYDAVPYADLSDFFYVWLKRSLNGQGGSAFETEVVPKQGELVQNAGLFEKDEQAAKQNYESGMAQAFARAQQALRPDGVMVVVFAHKDVQAWETLVSAMIAAGWTVTASWPIDTEMGNRTRALNSAALASSIWLVCRKRPETAGIGRYGDVMRRMQERITERLRYFWDQGISGPDFIWAAVGPALESYSSFREVRRLDGTRFTVGEFLREGRRMVTDFALGKILHGASTGTIDETTRYYLMHRHSFDLGPAPMGECILLAGGYGLNLDDLRGQRGILAKGGAAKKAAPKAESDDDEPGDEGEAEPKKMSGNDLRLLSFEERARPGLGEPLPNGTLPMIDMLHRLMGLWSAGQSDLRDEYAAQHGLGPENETFWAMAQSILEMSDPKTRERTLLEALVTWGRKRGAPVSVPAATLFDPLNESSAE